MHIDKKVPVTLTLEDWNYVLCCMGEGLFVLDPEILPAEYCDSLRKAHQLLLVQVGKLLEEAVMADKAAELNHGRIQ